MLTEYAAPGLRGYFRDRLIDAKGRVIREDKVRSNAIVADCRRILASFMAGGGALGIQGMLFGAGNPVWDGGALPAASPATTQLVDPAPFLVPAAALQIDFVDDGGVVVAGPTNRLQIVATLGAGEPPWPDGGHVSGALREFGIAGELGGIQRLINYVIHPVINKDPASTLERTLWLVF
jgi:hypothetical protein